MNAEIYKKVTEGKDADDLAMIDLLVNMETSLDRIASALEKITDKIPGIIEAMKAV